MRTLSVHETREFAHALLASKAVHDQRSDLAHMPRETLATHVGTYLSTKYGLRPLVLEWVHATNAAIAAHRHTDADVGALAAMLAHEVDEAYWQMHTAAKEVVADLLRVYLKGKSPLLSEQKIGAQLKARLAGKVPLAEDEWTDVLRYMHSHAEALTLTHTLREAARARAAAAGGGRGAGETGVWYAELLQTVCAFQLAQHRRFLSAFAALFRHEDADCDGSISAAELVSLAGRLRGGDAPRLGPAEAKALLARTDPHVVGRFTFSQAVAALASEIVHT
jgi:hypothetical protein